VCRIFYINLLQWFCFAAFLPFFHVITLRVSICVFRVLFFLFCCCFLPRCTARVFISDSPGKAAQWLARSIRESLRGVAISHSFAFSASRRLKFSYKSILPCTAFPSTIVSMLELSPPLPALLLLRVRGLSRLNTARVFRSDSRGKTAQWLARSIRESWGV
jgi:hypothetical protein